MSLHKFNICFGGEIFFYLHTISGGIGVGKSKPSLFSGGSRRGSGGGGGGGGGGCLNPALRPKYVIFMEY